MIGRLLVCAMVVYAAVMVWRSSNGGATNRRVACGVERWAVKTLQDRPVLRPARPTTVRFLVTRRPPAHLPATRRLPFERNVFTVVAAVTGIRAEDDGDLHLLLRSGRFQMIAEAPQAVCTTRAGLLIGARWRSPVCSLASARAHASPASRSSTSSTTRPAARR